MVLLDNLFSKKPAGKSAAAQDAGPTNLSPEDEQAMDRKSQRLERRELLYAVVRETMARVGVLSSSYKYKVLSLDSRGSQYLIMMDLPREMADHIEQLAEIEEVLTQTAKVRHKIDVSGVYWRINELGKSTVLRKPRSEAELAAPRAVAEPIDNPIFPSAAAAPAHGRRFEPIRPDEVHAFKKASAAGSKDKMKPSPAASKPGKQVYDPNEFPATEFEATQIHEEEPERVPLSRTQYGDLI